MASHRTLAFLVLLCSYGATSHELDGVQACNEDGETSCEATSVLLLQTLSNSSRRAVTAGAAESHYYSKLYREHHRLAADQLHILEYRASFVSNDGLVCYEGEIRTVVGSLALKQAGVLGGLYNETTVRSKTNCGTRGYTVAMLEDPTYNEIQMFVRHEDDMVQFFDKGTEAIENFAARHNIPVETASLMNGCTAQLGSEIELKVHDQCSSVDEYSGAWFHRDLEDHQTTMCCNSGPFQKSVYALATLKSTAQFAQHPYDQVVVGNCNDWGFMEPPVEEAIPGHCFTHLEEPVWFISFFPDPEIPVERVLEDEAAVFGGNEQYPLAFRGMGRSLGLDEDAITVMDTVPGCHCVPMAEMFQDMASQGLCQTPEQLPAIRLWWHGQ